MSVKTTTRTTTRSRSRSPGYCMDITGRMHTISTEDMTQILYEVKEDQAKNVVTDTLAALVTDVNATTEVLRRSIKRREPEIIKKKKDHSLKSAPPPPREPEIEYKLKIQNYAAPERPTSVPFPTAKRRSSPFEDRCSVEKVCQDFGIPTPTPEDNMKKRARSETPSSRKIIQIESSSPSSTAPICAGCCQPITGPCVTALAPNSERAQKFHPEHFVCTYCQKALQVKGTYREHEKKPYCHDCFYRLFSGLIYALDGKKQ